MESLCCMPETNTVLCRSCPKKNKVKKEERSLEAKCGLQGHWEQLRRHLVSVLSREIQGKAGVRGDWHDAPTQNHPSYGLREGPQVLPPMGTGENPSRLKKEKQNPSASERKGEDPSLL